MTFYRYAAGDDEFSAAYSEGIGRPVLRLESAAAHIAVAEEWTAIGKP